MFILFREQINRFVQINMENEWRTFLRHCDAMNGNGNNMLKNWIHRADVLYPLLLVASSVNLSPIRTERRLKKGVRGMVFGVYKISTMLECTVIPVYGITGMISLLQSGCGSVPDYRQRKIWAHISATVRHALHLVCQGDLLLKSDLARCIDSLG